MKRSRVLFYSLLVVLLGGLVFLPKVSTIFTMSAQTASTSGTTNPNFNTLAPCPTCIEATNQPVISGTAVPSGQTPGTNPGISMSPCASDSSAVSDNAHHSKHKKHTGVINGLMKQLLQFFFKLITLLLQMLGGGTLEIPSSGEVLPSSPPAAEQPDSPSQAMEAPSSAPVTNPCPGMQGSQTVPSSGAQPPVSVSAPVTNPSGAVVAPSAGASSGTTNPSLGVCAIPSPAPGPNVVQTNLDSTAPLTIAVGGTAASPKIYDGGCHTVGTITIRANYVTVQNFKINASGQYGIDSDGTGITIQNNDIKGVHASGDGDLNAITFFGDDTKILNNTAIDFVTGSPGSSHTDGIQTWVSTSHPTASTNVTIKGNKFTGPPNPSRDPNIASIHQCVMAEGLNQGGNSGGNGNPNNWLIADNYFSDSWNQCIKLDGVNNASVTRNEFAGSSDSVIEIAPASLGVKYYSDNKVSGTYKNGIGTTVTQGAGPTALVQ